MGKRVVLYSSGMDSIAMAALWPHDLALYVDMGIDYQKAEIQAIGLRRHSHPDMSWNPKLQKLSLHLAPFDRPEDRILPFRNLMLICIAAQYGTEIAIGATEGDKVLDKSFRFMTDVSALLTYLSDDYWNQTPEKVNVVAPLKGMTKGEIVRVYLKTPGAMSPRDYWEASWSCYSPEPGGFNPFPCGTCKPCWRKWVAFKVNGFDGAPGTGTRIRQALERGEFELEGRGREGDEMAEAIGL